VAGCVVKRAYTITTAVGAKMTATLRTRHTTGQTTGMPLLLLNLPAGSCWRIRGMATINAWSSLIVNSYYTWVPFCLFPSLVSLIDDCVYYTRRYNVNASSSKESARERDLDPEHMHCDALRFIGCHPKTPLLVFKYPVYRINMKGRLYFA